MREPIKEFKDKYRFLSNFFVCDIIYMDAIYRSSEHLYQALKTTDQGSRDELIVSIESPDKAKQFGKNVTLRERFKITKDTIMQTAVNLKFLQNSDLADKLLLTEDAKLIEGNNWHDNYWGACCCKRCADKRKFNKLGEVLMETRKLLRIVR